MSVVFISYSREDKPFIAQLREAFLQKAQEIWIDWESIPASKSWWDEIKHGIATSNNFVVVMSPNSMSSPICHMEIEEARRLGKRIIPVFHADYTREDCLARIAKRLSKPDSKEDITRELWGNRQAYTLFDDNQKTLAPINYFFFKITDDFTQTFEALLTIILTDFDHKETQTRIGLRAGQWASRDHDVSFLLVGEELKDAEKWLTEAREKGKNPPPSDLQVNYIHASRADEDMRHRRLQAIRRARLVASVLAGVMLLFALVASLVGVNSTYQAQLDLATATFAQGIALVNAQQAEERAMVAIATITQAAIIEEIVFTFADVLLLEQDEIAEQLTRINQLIEQYPNEAHAYYARGLIYAQIKQHEEAIADFTQAIGLNSQIDAFYINRGDNYQSLGMYELAIADFTQAIMLDSTRAISYYNRGNAYQELGDYDQAIADFTQAIMLDPDSENAYNNRGIVYRELGDYDQAIADFNQIIQRNSGDALVYVNRGIVYGELGDYDQAIDDYNQAIALDDQLAQAYFSRGLIYYALGQYEDAIINHTQAITLEPTSVETYYHRGQAYLSATLDMTDEATIIDYFQKALIDLRFAESQGYILPKEVEDLAKDIETLLAEITPTP